MLSFFKGKKGNKKVQKPNINIEDIIESQEVKSLLELSSFQLNSSIRGLFSDNAKIINKKIVDNILSDMAGRLLVLGFKNGYQGALFDINQSIDNQEKI